MKRTAVVHFDNVIFNLTKNNPDAEFGSNFFNSEDFPARPNSTLRLNLINYCALRRLSKETPLDIFHHSEVVNSVKDLMKYDQVVVNTVAAKRTVEFVEDLISEAATHASPPELIFGTEYSWTNNVRSGNVSQETVDRIYSENLILRHTARTDRHLYEPECSYVSRVQEFNLGIDFDAMPQPADPSEKEGVLFVLAPEGRATKNNDEVAAIRDELVKQGLGDDIPVRVLAPPYTTSEYWDELVNTKFLVFTSVGETFSYVLNDALSMGVVCIRRPELFATRTSQFGVDSYWDVGLRYESIDDAVTTLQELNSDSAKYRLESQRAVRISQRRFGASAVFDSWSTLLFGGSLNTNSIFLVDVSKLAGGVSDAFRAARDFGCDVLMAYNCRGVTDANLTSYSLVSPDRSQAILPYCYLESKERLRLVGQGMVAGRFVEGPSESTLRKYLELVVRSNAARKILVDRAIEDKILFDALGGLKYLEGRDLRPIQVERVSVG